MASAEMNEKKTLDTAGLSGQTPSLLTPVDLSDQTQTPTGDEEAQPETLESKVKQPSFNRDYRFWMIMFTLVLATLLASLEATVVITSLPTIVENLKLGSSYIWVTNVFFLTT
jgi:hypothetical protein